HRPDRINILHNHVGFLVDCLEETEFVVLCIDGILENAVLVEIGTWPPEIHSEFLELGGAPDTGSLLDQAKTGVIVDKPDDPVTVHSLLCRDPDCVHMHHRCRDDHCHGCNRDMRQYTQYVGAVVAGNAYRIKDYGVNGAFLDLARIGSPSHHHCVDMGNPEFPVDLVDNAA